MIDLKYPEKYKEIDYNFPCTSQLKAENPQKYNNGNIIIWTYLTNRENIDLYLKCRFLFQYAPEKGLYLGIITY